MHSPDRSHDLQAQEWSRLDEIGILPEMALELEASRTEVDSMPALFDRPVEHHREECTPLVGVCRTSP